MTTDRERERERERERAEPGRSRQASDPAERLLTGIDTSAEHI